MTCENVKLSRQAVRFIHLVGTIISVDQTDQTMLPNRLLRCCTKNTTQVINKLRVILKKPSRTEKKCWSKM